MKDVESAMDNEKNIDSKNGVSIKKKIGERSLTVCMNTKHVHLQKSSSLYLEPALILNHLMRCEQTLLISATYTILKLYVLYTSLFRQFLV